MMKKWLSTPLAIAVLSVLAAGLIGFGGVGAAAAAPRIESRQYGAEVVLSDISTSLVETNAGHSGRAVASKGATEPLLEGLVPEGETLTIGKEYKEELAVTNDGDIPQYVRVTVNRYWEGEGGKDVSLEPSLIKLTLGDGWKVEEADNGEHMVFYYQGVLQPGDTTSPLIKSVKIDTAVLSAIGKGGEFEYEGVTFGLKARVDAVQDHNGTQAMTGAWGRTN